MTMTLNICGSRGTLPSTFRGGSLFGVATACFHVPLPDRHLIFDAGSGIVELGQTLLQDPARRPIDLFLTHFHLDHIMGLIFFAPMFEARWPIRMWTCESFGSGALEAALDHLLRPPLCPVTRDMMHAGVTIHELPCCTPTDIAPGVQISTLPLSHPGGNAALRLDHAGRSLVYSGDFEHGDPGLDADLRDFMSGADLALLDCTYTPESYENTKGYGHAHWRAAGEIAEAAQVKSWLGVHHSHLATDTELLMIEEQLSARFPNARLAREGAQLEL